MVRIKITCNNYEKYFSNRYKEDVFKGFNLIYTKFSESINNCNTPIEITKRINGILFSKKDNKLRIYSDPFRTIPLFIKREDKTLNISSEISDLFSADDIIDEVGIVETILYESTIGERTIFKDIKQNIAASYIEIDLITLEYSIKKYWNFDIKENFKIETTEMALEKLDKTITEIFKKDIEIEKKYLLGMSGGLDSRLTLAYLNKVGAKKIKTMTYGFTEKLLEYSYAKSICDIFEVSKPVFHKLTKKEYELGKNELAFLSGGQISMHHVHMYSFLKKNEDENLISTYYTDAILGWATKKEKKITNYEETQIYKKLLEYKDKMKREVFICIEKDIINLFSNFDKNSNFSNLDEYKYLIERNPKFHIYLAYQQGRYSKPNLLFCNYDLLELMLSIPIELRYEKRLVRKLFSNPLYFGNKLKGLKDVSSLFPWGEEYKGTKDYYCFKLLNRINAILLLITKGLFQFPNKYLTENLNVLLWKMKRELKKSSKYLLDKEVINDSLKQILEKLPLRNSKTGEKFALISIYNCLKRIGEK